MYPSQRRDRLLELLAEHRFVSLRDLASQLGVSEITMRRDLKQLKDQGLVETVVGGAQLAGGAQEPPFLSKRVLQAREKQDIARAALATLEPGMTVGLSAGTTTWTLARLLKFRGFAGPLTFVTNSVNVATELQANGWTDILLSGGNFRTPSDALVGPLAELTLRQLYTDVLFLGIHGMDLERGLMTPNLFERSVNRTLMEQAGRVVVVADHSKWGVLATAHVADWEEVDLVLTDSLGGEEEVRALRQLGVEAQVAPTTEVEVSGEE